MFGYENPKLGLPNQRSFIIRTLIVYGLLLSWCIPEPGEADWSAWLG
jgi:hypothetical protein